MDGFFTLNEDKEEKVGANRWTCKTCKLYKDAKYPQFDTYGEGKKGIMVIGSGFTEDQWSKSRPVHAPKDFFQHDIGLFLKYEFKKNGIDFERDCVYLNAVNCTTHKKVSVTHVGCCRQEKVLPAIRKFKPKAIFVLGIDALTSILGDRWGKGLGSFSRWRGAKIPDQDMKTWIFPVDDPADIRNNSKAYRLLWRNDIQSALAMDIVDFPDNPLDTMEIIYEYDGDVGQKVKEFTSPYELISFDYETSGIRPYREGHQIYCASVAVNERRVMSFMFPDDINSPYLDGFVYLLRDRKIGKMAHNMNFEETWTRWCLATQVIPWKFDTMLASHVIDSRPAFCGLKFQSYINFGVLGYDKEMEDWISSDGGLDEMNTFNELIKTRKGQEMLLRYCAIDSCLQYRLAKIQAPTIGVELPFV